MENWIIDTKVEARSFDLTLQYKYKTVIGEFIYEVKSLQKWKRVSVICLKRQIYSDQSCQVQFIPWQLRSVVDFLKVR